MKIFAYALCLGLASILSAQEEEAELEPTAPPYEVGALPFESGYMIERDGAPDLNFRFVENKIHLYWIDDEGLIMEPELDRALVRFTGSVRGRNYFVLSRLEKDAGLGTPFKVLRPHLYNVLLVIGSSEADNVETYRFRYTPSMTVDAPDESE